MKQGACLVTVTYTYYVCRCCAWRPASKGMTMQAYNVLFQIHYGSFQKKALRKGPGVSDPGQPSMVCQEPRPRHLSLVSRLPVTIMKRARSRPWPANHVKVSKSRTPKGERLGRSRRYSSSQGAKGWTKDRRDSRPEKHICTVNFA
jgi:hypothetical protein